MAVRDLGRFGLHVFLFVLAGGMMLFVTGVLHLFTSFFLWLILPSGMVYAAFIFLSILLFGTLWFLACRRRWGCLQAITLGGGCVPVLLMALMLISPLLPDRPGDERSNRQEPAVSSSGKYVLTVPIERSTRERGPFGYGMPYWHVTISDPNGVVIYRDDEDKFVGIRSIYWIWDEVDRVWLFDSDDGGVYVYDRADQTWKRSRWQDGGVGHEALSPPKALYPPYAAGR